MTTTTRPPAHQTTTQRAWAYLRVSTDAQDVANQRLEILDLAQRRSITGIIWIDDPSVSGRVSWRTRQIGPIIEQAALGDILIVAELSRLGRSMYEIMEILAEATRRGIHIYAARGGWALDGSIQSKIIAMVMAMAAEIERDLLIQRTRAAMATRRALAAEGQGWTSKSGRHCTSLGRPPGIGPSRLDVHAEAIRRALAAGVPQTRIAADISTTTGNLRHWLRRHPAEP